MGKIERILHDYEQCAGKEIPPMAGGAERRCQEARDEIDRLRAELEQERDRVRELEDACREIEALGHGSGSGRGYTCANIAQKALANSEKE